MSSPSSSFSPQLTEFQIATARSQTWAPVPRRCVVTGGTGFVGQRLVEMLVERGAEKVVCVCVIFDVIDFTCNNMS